MPPDPKAETCANCGKPRDEHDDDYERNDRTWCRVTAPSWSPGPARHELEARVAELTKALERSAEEWERVRVAFSPSDDRWKRALDMAKDARAALAGKP